MVRKPEWVGGKEREGREEEPQTSARLKVTSENDL